MNSALIEYKKVKDSTQIGMERSNVRSADLINLGAYLVVLPRCNSDDRCSYWLGALNGIRNRGCGINVLRFMGEIDDGTAVQGLNTSLSRGPSVPGAFGLFSDMVAWFNAKLVSVRETNYVMIEYVFDIRSKEKLEQYFEWLRHNMPNNSCTIARLNRDLTCADNKHITPGHYVLISKLQNGDIYTYEPLSSNPQRCVKFKYKGYVTDSFLKSYENECYVSISLLVAKYIGSVPMDIVDDDADNNADDENAMDIVDENAMDIVGRNKKPIKTGAFIMSDDTLDTLITDIEKSMECTNTVGGKRKSRKMSKNKTHKRKSCKKRTRAKKMYKNGSHKRRA